MKLIRSILDEKRRAARFLDAVHLFVFLANLILAIYFVWLYFTLGEPTALFTVSFLEVLFLLASLSALRSRASFLLLLAGVPCIILNATMNYVTVHAFNRGFLVQMILNLTIAVLGTLFKLHKRVRFNQLPWFEFGLIFLMLIGVLCSWGIHNHHDRGLSEVSSVHWAVPSAFDSVPAEHAGTLEEISYETKAYATDERSLTKKAWVYLPYGYDPDTSYNILYLMHGTGDDENYWLVTNPYNKTMLDQMIEQEVIKPLIVVTPTFYVEDDCADDLDQLTYSFREELRNDLMPFVEDKYSTYAKSCSDKDFAASRDHRAFAGLSRGAVTTYHSVFCGSLDYFSWFGTFSGSRTSADYFASTIQSEAMKDLPIHYLYVSTGNFDFALPGQVQDYRALIEMEPRLIPGENTCFDVFPMRYHSMGNWHLALYNCLQHLFAE